MVVRRSSIPFLTALCGDERAHVATRVVLIAAHPDDEIIGAGSRLARLPHAHVVYVTDGAPADMADARRLGFATPQAYAAARATEAAAGLALAGIGPSRIRRLEITDQTAATVLPALAERLVGLISALRPEAVVTHAYEGGHPDHDATACAGHLACHLLRQRGEAAPELIEMTSYHDADGSGTMVTDRFLPSAEPVFTAHLDLAEQTLKRRQFAAHATQASVLHLFGVEHERFRPAPAYDFTQPPHPWPPFYESFIRSIDGTVCRRHAGEALAAFGVTGPI